MGAGILLYIQDGPLDIAGLERMLNHMPCVVDDSIDEGGRTLRQCHLAGDRQGVADLGSNKHHAPIFWYGEDFVGLAVQWHDNPYGHGARLLHWVLGRHRCRAQEDEYAEWFEDHAGILGWMCSWQLSIPPSRSEIEAWVVDRLVGLVPHRLDIGSVEARLVFADSVHFEDRLGLHFTLDYPIVEAADGARGTLDAEEHALLTLFGELLSVVTNARWRDDGSLVIEFGNARICLPANWPEHADGLQLSGPQWKTGGAPWVSMGDGGALRVWAGVEGLSWTDPKTLISGPFTAG